MEIKSYIFALPPLILVSLICFPGCRSERKPEGTKTIETEIQEQKNAFFTIDFAEIIKHPREVLLSEIAESIEYIPLENTTKALLGNVFDIQLTAKYIFIKHSGSPLLTQFSRDGKFIRHVGKEGRGPKEYGLMRKFSMDEKNQLIYIHTNWTHKIMVFNFDGEYVKKLQFGSSGRGHISWSRDSFLVSFSEPHVGNEPFVFMETNFKGDTIQTTANHLFWDAGDQSQFMVSYWGRNEYYRVNNKLHMKGWYNDTVYTYDDKNKIIPKFFIDLKEHKIPDDMVYERKSTGNIPSDCYWTGVNESKNYVFVRYGDHYNKNDNQLNEQGDGCVLFNKNSKEGIALKRGNNGGFINDLDGGPPFMPKYSNDTIIFCELTALDFKEYLDSETFNKKMVKNPAQKVKLEELRKSIKEDYNHYLMIARLKD